MIVQPTIRGFICTTAHPDGCKAIVKEQIDYVKKCGKINGPKKVLVIGASMGYGLASRISAAFGSGASTIGVIFDKQGTDSKPGSAGWYNTAAFEEYDALRQTVLADEVNRRLLERFSRAQSALQMAAMAGSEPREADQAEFEKLSDPGHSRSLAGYVGSAQGEFCF